MLGPQASRLQAPQARAEVLRAATAKADPMSLPRNDAERSELLPKTPGQIWLNRVRIWLPPLFVLVGLVWRQPSWNLWGLPLILLGEALRTWAAGCLIKDETLTVGGPYAHLRNPLYLGSLLSGLGFLIVMGDWWLALVFLSVSLAIYVPTVKHEQDYLRRMYGEAYDAYCAAVPALLPQLLPARFDNPAMRQSRFDWNWVVLNKEHKTWTGLVVLFLLLWLRSALAG